MRNREPSANYTTIRSNSDQLANIILVLITFSTIVWGGWRTLNRIKDPHRLPLSRLIIIGERHYTTNNDIYQVMLKLGAPKNFIIQDIKVIEQQIKHIPWIKLVCVRKKWPDQLKIYLTEYVPLAHWNNKYLLDSSGILFSIPLERIGNQFIPSLSGPEGSQKNVLSSYLTMNKILTAANFQLKAVQTSSRYSWKLMLKNNIQLKLGQRDSIRRIQRFIRIYPILLQQELSNYKRISYVDLRYDTGVAIGWTVASFECNKSDRK